MLSMRGSSSTTSTCGAVVSMRLSVSSLALFEGEGEVAIRHCGWAAQPARSAWAVLAEEFAALGLLSQIDRQVRIGRPARQRWTKQNLLHVVGQQDAARALPGGVVHDAALEALIDEIGVARVGRGVRDGRAPDLEIEQAKDVRVTCIRLLG